MVWIEGETLGVSDEVGGAREDAISEGGAIRRALSGEGGGGTVELDGTWDWKGIIR